MRNDLDITSKNEQLEFINSCKVCRLGLYDKSEDEIYIVPMNFGYEYNGELTLYFHSSPSGRKHDIIKENAKVGFEFDTDFKLKEGSNACSYSAEYKSAIGNGHITIIDTESDKKHALGLIMEHYTGKKDWEYNPKYFSYVTIYKLVVDKISFRQHK